MVEITVRPGPTSEWKVAPETPGDPWGVASTEPISASPNWVTKAIEPITSYLPTQGRIAHEGLEQAGQGLSDLRPQAIGGPQGGTAGALWDVAAGSLKYVSSPIEAGLETVVGKPLEENFGIPKEYPEFAAGLAIPYYGLRGGKAQTTAKKVFTPEALGPEAEKAAGSIRAEQGIAARDTATTAAAIEPHFPMVNAMPDTERFDLMRYMEGRSSGATVPPQMQGLADTLRTAFEQRKAKIAAMPSHAQMQFVEDYYPHFWKDPNAAAGFAQSFGGVGKQGSGASMKARSMPTIEDGIRAGLEPVTTNPLEATMRYVTSMDRFIAQQRVLQQHVADGTIKYIQPKAMGASGHPEGFKVPQGYAPLEGRGATNATGGQAYAPESFARVYNNFVSRGIAGIGTGEYESAFNTARRASNGVTALELALSGYHALTMAQEGIVNEVARAVQQGGRKGTNPGRAMLTAVKGLAAPVMLPLKGGKVGDIATGLRAGTPEQREIVDILTEGGARFKGRAHALDLGNSAAGSFFKAWQRGSLKAEVLSDIGQFKGSPVTGKVGLLAKQVGRAMDTVMQPLFEHYIPAMKNGAAYENMADWMKVNPTASRAEQVAAARKIVDSVDNRFGEMIQDNIFWNKMLKDVSMLSMRSYSWNLGTVREIGGGITDTLSGAGKGGMTQRQAYNIALPIVYGLTGGAYQYLKTGEAPKDLHDYVAPRTGGIDVTTGEPERIVPPGYMKDVFGWMSNPRQEGWNKVATAPRLAGEILASGRDWRGDPIAPPREDETSIPSNVPTWLRAYFTHVVEAMGPISAKSVLKGQREGSNLNWVERAMGVQPTGMEKTAPEAFEVMMRRKQFKEWQRKQMHDEMDKAKYQGYKGP